MFVVLDMMFDMGFVMFYKMLNRSLVIRDTRFDNMLVNRDMIVYRMCVSWALILDNML